MSCSQVVSLGAYLLGALEPAERSEVDQHLAGCAVCQRELVRLAPLPGLLSRVSPADFAEPEPVPHPATLTVPPDLPRELTADPPPEEARPVPLLRRRRTWLLAAAAAVLVAVLGAGGVLGYRAFTHPPASVAAPITWSGVDTASGVHATAELVTRDWGTEVRLQMRDLPSTKRCELLVLASDGGKEVAGWWATGYDSATVDIPLATSVEIARIQRLQVVTADHDVLVSLTPPVR